MDSIKNKMWGYLTVAGIGTTLTAITVCGVLPAVGFGAVVAKGSLAALAQSVFYGGTTCGVFSALQSYGTVGVVSKLATSAAVGSSTSGIWAIKDGISWLFKRKTD